jgi:hypothetical protein
MAVVMGAMAAWVVGWEALGVVGVVVVAGWVAAGRRM